MKRIFLFAMLCLWGSAAYAQDGPKPFTVLPQYPVGGGEVTLAYNNSQTPLAGSKAITGVIYLCDGYEWTVDDLDLEFGGGVWTATYTLPGNSVIFMCKFYGDDGAWDSGSDATVSYGMFVYNVDGEKVSIKPRTYMNKGIVSSKALSGYAIPGFLPEDYLADNGSTNSWFLGEAYNFPQSGEDLIYYSYVVRNEYEPGKHNESLANDIEVMLSHSDTKEISLLRAAEMARTILKDEDKAKQIETVALECFPNGLLARDGEIRKIFNEKDKAKAFRDLEEFVDRFPPHNFPKPQTRADEVFYTRLYWTVLRDNPDKAYNVEVLKKYLPLMTFSDVGETYYRGIYLPHDKRIKTAEELRPYADVIYAELMKRINGGEDLYYSLGRNERYSPLQWREKMMYDDGKYILQHAKILMETGSPEQALEILEPLRPILDGKISVFNDVYAQLLVINGYDQLVIPFIVESVRVDAATPEMLETLRADFLKKNPGGDFNAYLDGLRSEEYVAHMVEKLLAQLVREKIDLPMMESIRGGMVDLEKLKGKVIFLDFWATWCGPCMAAMPGVKMAQDKYTDNPNVAFYFVNTMERGGDPREYVPEVMEMKGWQDFNVLYDLKGDGYGAFSKKFQMSGIPQKVIIDQEGYVRWVSGGYFGNPLELANEISFIINHLLDEKK